MTLSKNLFLLTICFLIIGTRSGIAQKGILFQVKFKQNKNYITEMLNDMQIEVDFDGDSAKKKQMEASGAHFPIHMSMLQEITMSTKTGQVTTDKRIPMTMTYDKVAMTTSMNGEKMKQPEKLAGMKIKAYAMEDGKISIDTVEGNLDMAIKAELQKMITQLFGNVEFPNKAMKIGDTFTQEVPMEMPMNKNIINMLIKVTYTLKDIKNSQAFFDYTQSLDMNMKIAEDNSTATGSGGGKMIYDIPASYVTDTTGDTMINMNMQMPEMLMKMNLKMKTSMKAKVL